MARFGNVAYNNETGQRAVRWIWQELLVIPEATLLLALLVIGWAFDFPTAVTWLIALVAGFFIARVALMNLALQQLQHGAYEEADRFAAAATRLHPWSVDSLQLQAEVKLVQGNDTAAIPLLRRANAVAHPAHIVNQTLLATLLGQGALDEAEPLLQHAGDAVRLSPYAILQLAWYSLHVEVQPAKTLQLLRPVRWHNLPASLTVALLVTRADAELALADVVAARATIDAILARLDQCSQTEQAELHFHLARLQSALGDDGYHHYRRCVALDPRGRYAQAAWRGSVGNERG